MNTNDIAGAILAGGKSSRMGSDKALLTLDGKTLIQVLTESLSSMLEDVMIIADHGYRYEFLNIPSFPDTYKNCGPLGGIHSALTNSEAEKVLIVSCDTPSVSLEVLQLLLRKSGSEDALIVKQGETVQPLCGLYRRHCLPIIEEELRGQRLAVMGFLDKVQTSVLDLGQLLLQSDELLLANLNTPADYHKWIEKGRSIVPRLS